MENEFSAFAAVIAVLGLIVGGLGGGLLAGLMRKRWMGTWIYNNRDLRFAVFGSALIGALISSLCATALWLDGRTIEGIMCLVLGPFLLTLCAFACDFGLVVIRAFLRICERFTR